MDSADFLNLSRYRNYPFVSQGAFAPWHPAWVADCQIILGIRSGFVPSAENTVQLLHIAKGSGTVTFTFQAGDTVFTFSGSDTAAVGTTLVAEGDGDPAYGFGFLQLGDISTIPAGTTYGPATLLPNRVQSLHLHQVATLNAANELLTGLLITCNDETCDIEEAVIEPPGDFSTAALDWDGDIAFEGGQYATVDIAPEGNVVLFGGSIEADAGEQLPCETADLIEREGDELTSCSAALYAINGIKADPRTGILQLEGAAGVAVAPHPDEAHRLQVLITPRLLFGAIPEEPC